MAGPLEDLRRFLAGSGGRLYAGSSYGGMVLTNPQQALLVLGPPRSGKTSGVAIPNVLAAPGPVVTTSTKPDVMAATLSGRRQLGRCWLLDPWGQCALPDGVEPIRWSPVASCATWDDSLLVARSMTLASRPAGRHGDSAHWTERAEALLAPLLHAANLQGSDIATVQRWVLRHDLDSAASILGASGQDLGAAVLAGLAETDPREMSGIWSTTAGVLAAYRSERVLDRAAAPNFDPALLSSTNDTVYVCAPARHQDLTAPIVVAFLDQARSGAYDRPGSGPHMTFVLDELANIAPIPDLPALVSEGGSQGVLTIGCLQDLSQARSRWGPAADGFLSLFGSKIILPGIGDQSTLELVSRLGGEVDVPVRGTSQGPWWSAGHGATTESWSPQRRRVLPLDAVAHQPRGTALLLNGATPPTSVGLPPYWHIRALRSSAPSLSPPARSIER
jgi:type IV secretion system protein VirD4